MANQATINAETLAAVKAASSKLVGEAFNTLLLKESANKDVFGQMEGPQGSGRPFTVKTDLRAGKAQTVNFATVAELAGEGVTSDNSLRGNEENPPKGTWNITVDQIRHAVGWTQLIEYMMATGQSLETVYESLMASWFGRKKQDDIMKTLIQNANAFNTVRPNNTSSVDQLVTTDTINTQTISTAIALAGAIGVMPANVSKSDSGSEILQYVLFGGAQGLTPLKSNSAYLQAVTNAQARGASNTLFRGGYADWDGTGIFHWNVVDGYSGGAIGAPIEARAFLRTAITAGTTALVVVGGSAAPPSSNTQYYKPFKWFSGYVYTPLGATAPSADSGTRYFIVYNITGADAGKFGVYSYVGSDNLGYQITTTNRLGSAASGTRVTSLAGQTWDSNIHTDAHPAGSIIIEVNALCVPFTRMFVLGESSVCRAYGSVPMRSIRQVDDYGEAKGMGIKSIYGQGPRKDPGGAVRSYVMIESAYNPVGVSLPVVTG